jgi:hypothetical protein
MIAALVAVGIMPAQAQLRPAPQKQLSRGAVDHVRATPAPRATHVVYGTLNFVRGSALVLQTRRGALIHVDAAAAIASGMYSAPLFVGKVVAVGGYYDASRVLHASNVQRLSKLDATTNPDR